MFGTDGHFHPSLIFASKGWSLTFEWTRTICSTRVGSRLSCKCYNMVVVTTNYKYSCLLWGNVKAYGREPKSWLGQVFNFKLGCFCYKCNCMAHTSTPTSRVKNRPRLAFSFPVSFLPHSYYNKRLADTIRMSITKELFTKPLNIISIQRYYKQEKLYLH